MPPKISIWLDCDTGHDDAFAILIAGTHPKVDLLGISTVFGNASLRNTTYNTRAILKAIGREDVPVYAGSAAPFCRETAHAADIHGETGLDGTTCLPEPTVPAKNDKVAIEAMEQALRRTEPGTAWIVATGTLTNVALLLAVYPDLADHIAGVSVMGGAIGDGFAPPKPGQVQRDTGRIGNWTHWAEFNIYIDPESAKAVFNNPALQADVQKKLLQGSGGEARKRDVRTLFVEILTFFAKTYAEVFGLTDGPPLHDPLAVMVVLDLALFDNGRSEQFKLEVITDGEQGSSGSIRAGSSQCGRTIAQPLSSDRRGVLIPKTLDQEAIWNLIDDLLATVEAKDFNPYR